MTSFNAILDHAIQMAKLAGDTQLKLFRSKELEIATKQNDFDVVTAADKESERIIVTNIKKYYPDHSVLTEESGFSLSGNGDWVWVIDPLDGTTNYSCGLPLFNVSIGIKHQGETVAGVVYAPRLGEMFTATRGGGAALNGHPIKPSLTPVLSKAVVSTGFPYDKATNPINNIREVSIIIPQVRGFRRMGSAAYDLCCTAMGTIDAYWEYNLNPWDVCAGQLIVQEAGGIVIPLCDNRKISIIAGPEALVKELETVIKS